MVGIEKKSGHAVTMEMTTTERKKSDEGVSAVIRLAAKVDRIARGIETGAMVVSALAIAVTTVIVCAEVVLRSFFGISTLISAEYAGYLLAATVYLGLAWTFRNGGFIRVELIHSLILGRAAAIVNFLIAGIATATLVVYSYHIFTFVLATEKSGATSIFITRTPLWIPMVVMPVGSILLTFAMFSTMLRAGFVAIWPDGPVRLSNTGAEDFL
ncbi:TRAP transporter small permease subunit [Arenibacterium halophilum]|uniref:TRAP transporter small permease protein n=1 Tax=Arenibacterium halophilum TaxID=2583821 RepID=A0ABY2X160_9RHOB|nr:TRAP transporter small permease [Arenibacterium halophilum]TMV08373.1 TRAP transporter small permease [Arenibacterium halophilum]